MKERRFRCSKCKEEQRTFVVESIVRIHRQINIADGRVCSEMLEDIDILNYYCPDCNTKVTDKKLLKDLKYVFSKTIIC